MSVYYDPGEKVPRILQYKGRTTQDAAAFYAPYVPLQVVRINLKKNVILNSGSTWVQIRSANQVDKFLKWCKEANIHCILALDSLVATFDNELDAMTAILRWSGDDTDE